MSGGGGGGEEARYRQVQALDPGAPGASELLLHALRDESWRVRRAAAEALARAPDPRGLAERLAQVLHERGNPGARNAAAEALGHLGEAAVAPVLARLRHEDPDVRKFAADVLGLLGRPEAEGALVGALADADANVRAAAAEALARVGGEAAEAGLLGALRSGEAMLQLAALEALAQRGAPAPLADVAPLTAHPLLARSAFRMLGRCRLPQAVERAVEGLGVGGRAVRESALAALGVLLAPGEGGAGDARRAELVAAARAGLRRLPDAAARVEAALGSEDVAARRGALAAAAALGEPRLASAVAQAAGDERLASEAVAALLALGPEAARRLVPELPQLSLPARVAAGEALLGLADASLAGPLVALLAEPDEDLQRLAARALGRTGAAEAVEALAGLLEDAALASVAARGLEQLAAQRPEEVRRAAERALEGEASPAAVAVLVAVEGAAAAPTLRRCARHARAQVRAAAAEAAAAAGPDAARALLRPLLADESARVRRAAVRTLGRLGPGPDAAALLGGALRDEDAGVRLAAVAALGEAQVAERAAELEGLAAGADAGLAVAALRALARLGPVPEGAVARAAGHADGEVVKAALEAAGPAQAPALAAGLLGDGRWDVRVAAARALVRAGRREQLDAVRAALAREDDALAREALERAEVALAGR